MMSAATGLGTQLRRVMLLPSTMALRVMCYLHDTGQVGLFCCLGDGGGCGSLMHVIGAHRCDVAMAGACHTILCLSLGLIYQNAQGLERSQGHSSPD